MLTPFRNEPYVNFSEPGPRKKMEEALKLVESKLGRTYPLIIAGEHVETGRTFDSINPGNTDQVVGTFHKCTAELTVKALEAADAAFESWRFVPAEHRARYLLNAAQICRERVFELCAWMVFEEGKNWLEAYADACEGIDFLEFYAREAVRYGRSGELTPWPGEENDYFYIPLGAGVAIPPWNFPFAIMAGITVAPMMPMAMAGPMLPMPTASATARTLAASAEISMIRPPRCFKSKDQCSAVLTAAYPNTAVSPANMRACMSPNRTSSP